MEPSEAVAALKAVLGCKARVAASDGRRFYGVFMCIDRYKNIVLSGTEEEDAAGLRRYVGLVMVPGKHFVSMAVEHYVERQAANMHQTARGLHPGAPLRTAAQKGSSCLQDIPIPVLTKYPIDAHLPPMSRLAVPRNALGDLTNSASTHASLAEAALTRKRTGAVSAKTDSLHNSLNKSNDQHSQGNEDRLKRQRISVNRLSSLAPPPTAKSAMSAKTLSAAQVAVNARATVTSRIKLANNTNNAASIRSTRLNSKGAGLVSQTYAIASKSEFRPSLAHSTTATTTASNITDVSIKNRGIENSIVSSVGRTRPWNQSGRNSIEPCMKNTTNQAQKHAPIARSLKKPINPTTVPLLSHSAHHSQQTGLIAQANHKHHNQLQQEPQQQQHQQHQSLSRPLNSRTNIITNTVEGAAMDLDHDIDMEPAPISQQVAHGLIPKYSLVISSNKKSYKAIKSDHLLLEEYSEEIFQHMKAMEVKSTPNPRYIDHQPGITWEMRRMLIDWLQSLHHKLRLLPETLYLTINIMDRFMSVKPVSVEKFQLVGVSAMFIASKYEEIMIPSVKVMEYMVGGGYSCEEILKGERFVLGMLKFWIGYNGPCSFLRRLFSIEGKLQLDSVVVVKCKLLARYFCEAVLLDERFIGAPPSLVSAAAVYLGKKILNSGEWTEDHVKASGYVENEITECAKAVYKSVSQIKADSSVFQKYCDPKFGHVASYIQDFTSKYIPE